MVKKFILVFALSLLVNGTLWGQGNPFDEDEFVTSPSSNNIATVSTIINHENYVAIGQAWVNVRSGPGTNYRILTTLPNGTIGRKLSERNGWYLINFGNGIQGWVRGDLVTDPRRITNPRQQFAAEKAYLEKNFERWDRHHSDDLLNYSKFPWYWSLARAARAYAEGNWKKAYELALEANSNPIEARYLISKALYKMGNYAEAYRILKTIERPLEDAAMLKVLDKIAQPYIDEPIVFKFGGFDTIAQFRAKKAAGYRLGLESSEYYSRFVDIKTWQWKSVEAYKEFQKIGGIDCSGFVQRIQQEAFAKAKVNYPIVGRTSTFGLASGKYTVEINPGYRPPPPPDIRPGDMILLDYGHNRYGHSMIYRGKDAHGNIRVLMMGDTAVECALPPEKLMFYRGTFRMKGMDEVRKILTA